MEFPWSLFINNKSNCVGGGVVVTRGSHDSNCDARAANVAAALLFEK